MSGKKELALLGNPQLIFAAFIASDRFKQLRNLLALVATVRFSGEIITAMREFGVFGLLRELIKRLKKTFFDILKSAPIIGANIEKEITKGLKQLEESVLHEQTAAEDETTHHFLSLPRKGLHENEIEKFLLEYKSYAKKHRWEEGKLSGAVYHGGEDLTRITHKAMEMFAWSNPLHADAFPGVRKCEAEIIACVVDMYHGSKIGAVGLTTSGGTESIFMAVRAHKEWAKETKGITTPHIVLPRTAHPAFDKAAHYMDIRITHVDLNPDTLQVDVRKLRAAITPSTIMVVASCPGYPHGIMDDVARIAEIAERAGIGCHVDCCLGGFIVPFMHDAGYSVAPFDFRVAGVTSISCDTHKYGFAPKGSSVVMYRTPALRRFAYFSQPDWPGAIYATPTVTGSRNGALIVGCWAALMYNGRSGYVHATREIVSKMRQMVRSVKEYPELQVLGEPLASVFAFTSSKVDIYRVSELLGKRGWGLSPCQFPAAIHYTVTHLSNAETFSKDLADVMVEIRQNPSVKAGGSAALYGMSATIPDRTLVDRFARGYIDALTIPYQKQSHHGHGHGHGHGLGHGHGSLQGSAALKESQEVKESSADLKSSKA